jgi:hypothetical protein
MVWAVLALVYLVFLAWFDWSGGPLSAAEVDTYVARLERQGLAGTRVLEEARAFAEGDDGEEFFMVNLENQRAVPLIPDDLPEGTDPREAEARYTRSTGIRMISRAGFPVMALGGRMNFIDYDGAPVWENLLLVRYRSRRDFFEVFTHPETSAAIQYKFVFYGKYQAWPTWSTLNLVGVRAQVLVGLAMLGAPIHLLLARRESGRAH